MILVTVGTQLAFPRLVGAMDAWAARTGERVVAQVGPDRMPRRHLEVRPHLEPAEFDALFAAARAVVGHAGMGTILSARRHCRPLVIVPRRHALGEHRNDHQIATARALEGHPGIHVAWEAGDIAACLARDLAPAGCRPGAAHGRLVDHLARFIAEDPAAD